MEVEQAFQMSRETGANKDENPKARKRLLESILKRRAALDFLIKLA